MVVDTGMNTIMKKNASIEAGEMVVPKDDAVSPSKLKLLADCGWSIQDVWRDGKGFTLLLTRNVQIDTNKS